MEKKVLWVASWSPRNIHLESETDFRAAVEDRDFTSYLAFGSITGDEPLAVREGHITEIMGVLRERLFIPWSDALYVDGFLLNSDDLENLQAGGLCYCGILCLKHGLRYFAVKVFPPSVNIDVARAIGHAMLLSRAKGGYIGFTEVLLRNIRMD